MPSNNLEKTRKILPQGSSSRPKKQPDKRNPKKRSCGCIFLLLLLIIFYFLAPFSTRMAILGIDRAPAGTMAGRSDTIMLVSVNPLFPTIKALSIPRDLWVSIPDIGENRINTAHFFAEASQPGSGPLKTMKVINENFKINIRHYLRFNLENFPQIVDALGGITLDLPQSMAGFPAGRHRLNGDQALAFLRSRSDGDDFFRMRQGQIFVLSFVRELIHPVNWPRIPLAAAAASSAVDTNLPIYLWPRIGLALIRGSFGGFDTYAIDRSMVTPFVTSEGAQVLLPDWNIIHPYIQENF